MGNLKVLPAQLANMIAAGEVVQRPASVVKELMENAVDAGAGKINVIIEDAGRTLIQVIDDGCGMSPSDAVLCFERHATSKIAEEADLGDILTYGFRGEALASIAAVAEVTLKTRRAQDDTATQVKTGGGSDLRSSSVAAPVGSSFAVRNLFFNTPARRKFLKSDNVEFRHIVEEFTRVAITRPGLAFTLTHNGREIYVLKKEKSLKYRILNLLGGNMISDIVDIGAESNVAKVSGFVGRPDTAKKTPGSQYFFVNGRFFKSAYLHKAVMKAYEGLIPDTAVPAYFIFLEVDPHSVDVNVHPTKTEIKFEDEPLLFQFIYASVRETLGKNSFGASIDFDTDTAVQLPQLSRNFSEYLGGSAPSIGADESYNPFSFTGEEKPGAEPQEQREAYDYSRHVDRDQDYGQLFSGRAVPSGRTIVLQDKYILTPVASGVMVVNISRARERIMFDRTIRTLSDTKVHCTQTSLFPVDLELGLDAVLLLEGKMDLLTRLGFDIKTDGKGKVTVGGVPEGYSCEAGKVESLVREIVYILSEEEDSLQEIMNQRLAERFAATAAKSSDSVCSTVEAQRLIDTLFASENAEFTSNGRRIIHIVSIGDLDKLF